MTLHDIYMIFTLMWKKWSIILQYKYNTIVFLTDPMIIFSDTAQSKPVTEKVDILMSKIGLTDHKPVPEPVKFSENDPLGTGHLKSATSSGDVLLTLCKSE
jgi:hypothetical protein